MVSERNRDLLQGHVTLNGLCQCYLGIIPYTAHNFWKNVAAEFWNAAPHIEVIWTFRGPLSAFVQAEKYEKKKYEKYEESKIPLI